MTMAAATAKNTLRTTAATKVEDKFPKLRAKKRVNSGV